MAYENPSLLFFYIISISLLLAISLPSELEPKCILFNFGDSNSDTGNHCAGLGLCYPPPHGQLLSSKELSPRYSDGRNYLDFLCESLGVNYLSPYLESSSTNFRNGANFAFAGAGAHDCNCPLAPLGTQIKQFRHFQKRTQLLREQGKGPMISDEEFSKAIYSIDIGQNDIAAAFDSSGSYDEITSNRIPEFLEAIEDAVKEIHGLGGRKFWLYNTGPIGCLQPYLLWNAANYSTEVDETGCRLIYNNAAKAFNKGFDVLCDKIRSELNGVVIVCIDTYNIKYDLFLHHDEYGFDGSLMPCMGLPICAHSVNFDGFHYTEAANGIIASKILLGSHSSPDIKLSDLCKR